MGRNLKLYKRIGFFVLFFSCFVLTLAFFKINSLKQLSIQNLSLVVRNAEYVQAPSLPGQPITWVAKISASAINSGQHFLILPKTYKDIKYTNSSQLNKVLISSSTTIDRLKLSEIARQNANSKASQALLNNIKEKKEQKTIIPTSIKDKLTASVLSSLNKFGHLMSAAVDDAIATIEPAPETQVAIVDIVPTNTEVPNVATANTEAGDTANSTETTPSEEPAENGTSTVGVEDITETPSTVVNDISTTTTLTESPSAVSTSSDEGYAQSTSSLIIPVATTTPAIIPLHVTEDVVVQYETPAPVIAEATTQNGKIVTISDSIPENSGLPHTTNVLAFTNIPEIYKVGQEGKIKIKWINNNDEEVVFKAYDLNNNGKLDYVEWTVPHLSTQTFEIIFISKALELDENREIIGDIYDQVKTQDGNWATIPDGHAVQVTFEKYLTNKNDNTIYARASGTSTSVIEVYAVYDGIQSSQPVAIFDEIENARTYKVWLTNLSQSTNTFNLKVIGDVDIDYIVDPTPVTVTELFADTTKVASAVNVTVDTTNGQVTLTATSGWTCGSPLIDFRDGKSYATVLIGAQCWMQQNLNVGTRINGGTVQGTSATDIKKYCSGNSEANCTTYGGWYQRDQVLAGTTTPGTQGICPPNWHVPTHYDFTTLERNLCTSASCATDFPYDTTTTGGRGTNEGATLKDSSGVFKALLAGNWGNGGGQFYNIGNLGIFFTSTWNGSSIWRRVVSNTATNIGRDTDNQLYDAFSVRCLKD